MGTSFMDKQLREIFLSRRARFMRATHPNELIATSDWHVIIESNSLTSVSMGDGTDFSASFREWFSILRLHIGSKKALSTEEIIAKIPRLGSRGQGLRLYSVTDQGDTLRMSYTSRYSKNLNRRRDQLVAFVKDNARRGSSFEIVYGDEIAGRLVRVKRFFDGGFTALTPKGYRNFRYDRILGFAQARGMGRRIPKNRQVIVAFNRQFSRVFLDGFPQD